MEPTLAQVIEVVRESSGIHRKPIDNNTWIEADLHICGMDGEDLLGKVRISRSFLPKLTR